MIFGNALSQRGTKGRMEHLLRYIILGQKFAHNLTINGGEILVNEQRLHDALVRSNFQRAFACVGVTLTFCSHIRTCLNFEKEKKLDSNKEQVFGYKILKTHVHFS